MQDLFKSNVSMQDTHTQIMSSCKTLQFRKTCLLSLVGRYDLLKDMSSCLKMQFYCFYFLCFILLKTCLFPRHVLNMAPRHDFYNKIILFRGVKWGTTRLWVVPHLRMNFILLKVFLLFFGWFSKWKLHICISLYHGNLI